MTCWEAARCRGCWARLWVRRFPPSYPPALAAHTLPDPPFPDALPCHSATLLLPPCCSFLEESAVFLADEPMTDVEAMLWVLGLQPEQREAKVVGLAALRAEMYDRNLQVQTAVQSAV